MKEPENENVRIYLDLTPEQYKKMETIRYRMNITEGMDLNTIQDIIRFSVDNFILSSQELSDSEKF